MFAFSPSWPELEVMELEKGPPLLAYAVVTPN